MTTGHRTRTTVHCLFSASIGARCGAASPSSSSCSSGWVRCRRWSTAATTPTCRHAAAVMARHDCAINMQMAAMMAKIADPAAFVHRTANLPVLSRPINHESDAGARADGLSHQTADSARTRLRRAGSVRAAAHASPSRTHAGRGPPLLAKHSAKDLPALRRSCVRSRV